MPTTNELVDESRLLEDGILTDDPATIKRWRSCLQEALDLTWNARFWHFKLITYLDSFEYDPTVGNPNSLPDDFGSFEALGAGVYGTRPVRALKPAHIGVVNAYALGTPNPAGVPSVYAVNYVNGAPNLVVAPPKAEPFNLIYLRRSPRVQYSGIDSGGDEISFVPEQWHRPVLATGMRWRNKLGSGSAIAKEYETIWKAGLKEMQEREKNGGLDLNTLAMWRPTGTSRR